MSNPLNGQTDKIQVQT